MQRLRRACQRKKNSKVPGGEDALTMYKDTDKRLEMARTLIEAKFDKDPLHAERIRQSMLSSAMLCNNPFLAEILCHSREQDGREGEGEKLAGGGRMVLGGCHEGGPWVLTVP